MLSQLNRDSMWFIRCCLHLKESIVHGWPLILTVRERAYYLLRHRGRPEASKSMYPSDPPYNQVPQMLGGEKKYNRMYPPTSRIFPVCAHCPWFKLCWWIFDLWFKKREFHSSWGCWWFLSHPQYVFYLRIKGYHPRSLVTRDTDYDNITL